MKAFVDWSILKGFNVVGVNDNGEVLESVVADLTALSGIDIYIESGCPQHLLHKLVEMGSNIFICQGIEVKKLREGRNAEKTDKADAGVIYKLYCERPDLFKELDKSSRLDIEETFLMGKYRQITQTASAMKNRQKAAEKEYGKIATYEESIKILEAEKAKMLKLVLPLIKSRLAKVKHIKGVGIALTGQLLALADPRKFPTLSKYLAYCGYKGSMMSRYKKGTGKRPNFAAKSVLYQMAEGTLKASDLMYRKVYDECKARFQTEHVDWSKSHMHGAALIRVATLIAKEFWHNLHNEQMTEVEERLIKD